MTERGHWGAADEAYQFIRNGIITNRFPEGSRLAEEELARLSGLSRTPVREAIRRLAAEGFAITKARSSATVASWNGDKVAGLFGTRAVLESYGCSLAARRGTPADIRSLENMCTYMEGLLGIPETDFLKAFSKANTEFHVRLLEMSGNEHLLSVATPMIDLALIMRTYRKFSPEQIRRSCSDHREIVAALSRGDAHWAEAIMKAHILSSVGIARTPFA
ncbi:GntR family transcriptional regulator [Aurantimonas sp. A2-1-M11]|uniref:GntR family transcriptional regulator n=1 Tax=Aurantimonas sp. A2-1-M11 TaxID=3113712 RepID=UPI002F95894D